MTNYKDNLPPYAEELILNEETISIQQILNKFDQLVPEGFTELGQPKKYWGSTEGLDKLLCERYTFKYDGKSYTLDIGQGLSDKLKLTPKDNFCVKEEVLSYSPEEGGITLNSEEEIFLKKSFTVNNLEEDIDKLFDKIKHLKEELQDLKQVNNQIFDLAKNFSIKETLVEKVQNATVKIKEVEEISNNFKTLSESQIKEAIFKLRHVGGTNDFPPTAVLANVLEEYCKEKFWWDKWINDNEDKSTYYNLYFKNQQLSQHLKQKADEENANTVREGDELFFVIEFNNPYRTYRINPMNSLRTQKVMFKHLYQYYRDK